MAIERELFPRMTRPLEYVAFLNLRATTLEGPAYIFLACDGFTEFCFKGPIESDEHPKSILKAVSLLMEDENFVLHRHTGFTLVFDRWEALRESFEDIVKPYDGKILYHEKLHEKIAAPLIASLKDYFERTP